MDQEVDSQARQDSVRRVLVILHARPFVLTPLSTLVCSDGKVQIDSTFSCLLGKLPIMVAGIQGQGRFRQRYPQCRLPRRTRWWRPLQRHRCSREIQSLIPPGVGITLNSLYINPCQFGFQFPLWQEMKHKGLPIEGFCVAAGIPSTEKAAEIIGALRDAGIKHVAFKPGSVDGIRQVAAIAATNPDYPIIFAMDWRPPFVRRLPPTYSCHIYLHSIPS